jgi:alpha-amylase/alpha-mannosidase (GH57 family)
MQAASHQRQLSLKYSEVQQRLINNQGILNILEKTRDEQLELLLTELKSRVEQDKEALRQWTALQKITASEKVNVTNVKNPPPLASTLLQFSRGCAVALQLITGDGTVVS